MSEENKGPGKTIIGLECHVQLDTKSKLFCGCPTTAEEPNSACCEICLGFPGSKPVLNRKALDYALRVALALNCEINREFFFSRKTYFYPDMSKNFQITQYEIPVGKGGHIILSSGKKIRIDRVHIEEDPAALVHSEGLDASRYTKVDYNRSGIPLIEVVTAPDLSSPQEARDFLDQLTTVLHYLGVFDLQNGTLKVDSNLSIEGNERAEVKNITGKRSVEKALAYEEVRQKGLVKKGVHMKRETRAFNEQTSTTRSMRSKESEADYGYIFDPDLPTFELSDSHLEEIRGNLPELHGIKAERFMKQYAIDEYTAQVLSANPVLGDLFEDVSKKVDARFAAKFLSRELLAIINYNNLSLATAGLDPAEISALLEMLLKGEVSERNAKQALIKYALEKIPPAKYIEEQGLKKDLDTDQIEDAVDVVLKEQEKAVADFKAGGQKALNFLVGQVMRKTKGKVEAREIQSILEKKLGA